MGESKRVSRFGSDWRARSEHCWARAGWPRSRMRSRVRTAGGGNARPSGRPRQGAASRLVQRGQGVVARGIGVFFDGETRRPVQPGTFLFVPAGRPHHFEDFTADFAVWVFFYGPEGGEKA